VRSKKGGFSLLVDVCHTSLLFRLNAKQSRSCAKRQSRINRNKARSFYATDRIVRMKRINGDAVVFRKYHQIHVFHGYAAQKHLISQNDSAYVALAVLEAQMNRTHIGTSLRSTIGQRHILGRAFAELELIGDFLRKAKEDRSCPPRPRPRQAPKSAGGDFPLSTSRTKFPFPYYASTRLLEKAIFHTLT
jgi:hypothetical protein